MTRRNRPPRIQPRRGRPPQSQPKSSEPPQRQPQSQPRTIAFKLAVAGAATAATAVIGGTVSFYLPRLLSPDPGKPILLNLEDNPEAISTFSGGGHTFAIPAQATTSSPGDPKAGWCDEFQPWVRRLNGWDFGATKFRVVLQGNTDRAVVVTRIEARVVKRENTPAAVVVGCPTAGNASIRALELPLDGARPVARELGAGKRPFGFTLAKGETEIIDIAAGTAGSGKRVTWVLVITATVGGKRETFEVRPDRPFRTQGPDSDRRAHYEWTDKWEPRSPFA